MSYYGYSNFYKPYDTKPITAEDVQNVLKGWVIGSDQVEEGSINYAHIGHAQIGEVHIREASINHGHIQNLAVGNAHIDNLAVTSAKIANGAINRFKLGEGEIFEAHIADAQIKSAHIDYAQILEGHIADAQIKSAHIDEAQILRTHIGEAEIDRTHIMHGEIITAHIAEGNIKSAHIDHAQIGTAHIEEGAITSALIDDLAVTEAKIDNASITSAKIAEASIGEAHIIDGAITNAKIGNAEITSAKIADGQITSAKIGDAQITRAKIEQGAIGSALIEEGSIGTVHIAEASITDALINDLSANKITSGLIDTTRITIQDIDSHLSINGSRIQVFDNNQNERVSIGDVNNNGLVYGFRLRGADGETILIDSDGVYNEGITDGAITNPKIGDGEIDNRVIQANTITGDRLVAETITGREISADTITARHILSNSITADEIDVSTITINTANIADGAITNAKLGNVTIDYGNITNVSIGTADIENGAITTAKIGNAQITTAKIDDLAVTGAKINNATIGTAKIIDGAITNAKIGDAEITNAKIDSIDASKITTGVLDAERIYVGKGSFFEEGFNPTTKQLLSAPTPEDSDDGGYYSAVVYGLYFRVTEEVRLVQCEVYCEEDGEIELGLRTFDVPEGTPSEYLITKTYQVKRGKNIIELDMTLDPSESEYWHLGRRSGVACWRTSSNQPYPFDNGSIQIVNGGWGNNANLYYYFFYNIIAEGKGLKNYSEKWTYGNTTYIDGGNIYADTITANAIKGGSFEGKTFTGGRFEGQEILGTIIEGQSEIRIADTPSYFDPDFMDRVSLTQGRISVEAKEYRGGSASVNISGYGIEVSAQDQTNLEGKPPEEFRVDGKGVTRYTANLISVPGGTHSPLYIFSSLVGIGGTYAWGTLKLGTIIGGNPTNSHGYSGEVLYIGSNTIVNDKQFKIESRSVNGGLALKAGDWAGDHYVVGHNTTGAFHIYPYRVSGENIFTIRSHQNKSNYRNEFYLNSSGEIISTPTRDNAVTWGGRVAIGASSGRFGYVSSSERYKLVIENVKSNPYNILKINPRSWYDKGDVERYADILTRQYNGEEIDEEEFEQIEKIRRVAGLIAEEVAEAGLEEFVTYGSDNQIDGVDYDRLWTLLIPIIRDILQEKNEMKEQLVSLQAEYDKLKSDVEYLKSVLS